MRGRGSPFLLQTHYMLDKFNILEIAKEALEGTDKYLVNLKITPDNRIFADIDGDNGITIDDCIELSRKIENSLNRDEEDFELNVSSAGADSPLKLPRQYRRHVGRTLSVDTLDSHHYEGVLESAGDQQITLRTKGSKKAAPQTIDLAFADIKCARVVIQF